MKSIREVLARLHAELENQTAEAPGIEWRHCLDLCVERLERYDRDTFWSFVGANLPISSLCEKMQSCLETSTTAEHFAELLLMRCRTRVAARNTPANHSSISTAVERLSPIAEEFVSAWSSYVSAMDENSRFIASFAVATALRPVVAEWLQMSVRNAAIWLVGPPVEGPATMRDALRDQRKRPKGAPARAAAKRRAQSDERRGRRALVFAHLLLSDPTIFSRPYPAPKTRQEIAAAYGVSDRRFRQLADELAAFEKAELRGRCESISEFNFLLETSLGSKLNAEKHSGNICEI